MRLHLRFTEKDGDLCRWRYSLKTKMLSHYICQILIAEMKNETASLPEKINISNECRPCDIYVRISDEQLEEFILKMPPLKRTAYVKDIIRKHLKVRGVKVNNFSEPKKTVGKFKNKKESIPVEQQYADRHENETLPDETETKKQMEVSEEDRNALMALIAMGGE